MQLDTEKFKIGVGTGHLRDDRNCQDIVQTAINVGYRHIDTASHYGNERAIGNAIEQSAVSRDELFVSTKVHSEDLSPPDVRTSVQKSRDRLGLNQIDLVYIHWPSHSYEPAETLDAFETLRDQGIIRHIGLSNFTQEQIEIARQMLDVPLFAIQVEMHPLLQQEGLREYARNNDFWVVAHSPLCGGKVTKNNVLKCIAEDHSCSAAQISLAWLISHNRVAAVPEAKAQYLRSNINSTSIVLREEDIKAIDSINTECRWVDYEFAPWES